MAQLFNALRGIFRPRAQEATVPLYFDDPPEMPPLQTDVATRLDIKVEQRARAEANALEEAMTKRVDALAKPLQGHTAEMAKLVKSLQADHDPT